MSEVDKAFIWVLLILFFSCELSVNSLFPFFYWVVCVYVCVLLFVGNLYSLRDGNNWNKRENLVVKHKCDIPFDKEKQIIFIKNLFNYLKKVIWSFYYILHTVKKRKLQNLIFIFLKIQDSFSVPPEMHSAPSASYP